MANLVLKSPNFPYHGNKSGSLVKLNDVIKLCNLENLYSVQNVLLYHLQGGPKKVSLVIFAITLSIAGQFS